MKRSGKEAAKPHGSKSYSRTPVTTYYRSDNKSQSPFQRRQPKRNRRKYIFGAADIILVFILIATLIYSLLVRGSPHIIASDESYHTERQYVLLIQSDFDSAADKNKITFNESGVVSRIEKQFPEVSGASVELPFFSEQPKVRLLVSPPAFKLKSSGKTYVIDQRGMVVTDEAAQPRFAKLMSVEDQSGFKATVGKPVLNSSAAGFIATVIRQSQRAGVPLSTVTLPAIPLEFDLRTKDQPYLVKFYLGGDANIETGQFLAARHKFAQSHIVPSQYLDVRVAGKIFYK